MTSNGRQSTNPMPSVTYNIQLTHITHVRSRIFRPIRRVRRRLHDAHALPSQQTVGVNKALSASTRARGDEFETRHGVVRALETESTARRVVIGLVIVSTRTRVIALLPLLLLLAPARRSRRSRLGHLSSRRHCPRARERWRDVDRTTTRRLDGRWTMDDGRPGAPARRSSIASHAMRA